MKEAAMSGRVTSEEIKKLDRRDMLGKLKGFSLQCEEAYSLPAPALLPEKDFNRIIFCGMGGSAIGGDIINALAFENSRIPCFVNRDYCLPFFADGKTLAVIISYSGNTEETLSALEKARERGCPVVCITSGGQVEKIASSDKLPLVKIPGGYPPRCAMGYLFFPCYKILSALGVLPELDASIFNRIRRWSEDFFPENEKSLAKGAALKFYGKIPLIYSGARFLPALTRWKTQIAENSKSFAFINVFPEMNHNEIMSWRYPDWFIARSVPVFITSEKEHPRTDKRFKITREIISGVNTDILDLRTEGDSLLEEIFYLIVLGDWISFYLAVLNGADPTEINGIDLLKKRMGGTS
ncbi:MAG: bifunctional phosphoglucose/phosphomannose isomerase [Candidatus Omnitrophica bacterium]|nr:bifunctional phosphoglucose/phosphomannose isomerase [Candidatus Omnitrophota bacterium]